jgi:hypothetical protein
MHTWLPAFAKAIGAPKPPHIQNSLAHRIVGRGQFSLTRPPPFTVIRQLLASHPLPAQGR